METRLIEERAADVDCKGAEDVNFKRAEDVDCKRAEDAKAVDGRGPRRGDVSCARGRSHLI